jgi:hypothetical protein
MSPATPGPDSKSRKELLVALGKWEKKMEFFLVTAGRAAYPVRSYSSM